MGIKGLVLDVIAGFLNSRIERVMVKGESRSDIRVVSSVPQCVVLGPSLFLLYMNDLH